MEAAKAFADFSTIILVSGSFFSIGMAKKYTSVSIIVTIAFMVLAVWTSIRFAILAQEMQPVLLQVVRRPGLGILVATIQVVFIFLLYCLIFSGAFMAIKGTEGLIIEEGVGPIHCFWQYMYFTIITGSTTGYGRMYPVGLARAVACAQIVLLPVGFGAGLRNLAAGAGLLGNQP